MEALRDEVMEARVHVVDAESELTKPKLKGVHGKIWKQVSVADCTFQFSDAVLASSAEYLNSSADR